MTKRFAKYCAVLLVLSLGAPVFAQQNAVDCKKLLLTTNNCRASGNVRLDPAEVKECIERGFDPPVSCRRDDGKSAGVEVGGSTGFSYGSIIAPENSAGAYGASPSISANEIRRIMRGKASMCVIPGGFNICQWEKNLCIILKKCDKPEDGNTVPPNSSCPQRDDTSGFFGKKIALAAGLQTLSCGGALPLTSYELTLNKGANHMASTEYGAFYLYAYNQASPTGPFNQAAGNPLKLPKYLCKLDSVTDPTHPTMKKSVDLTPPIAQMITYTNQTPNLVLRLQSRSSLDASAVPPPIPPYNENDPEKFLVIPITNGVPEVPADCADETKYYKELAALPGDLVIESAVNVGCEGTPAQCAGLPLAPTPTQSCTVINLVISGTFNGEVCTNRTQYAVLDRPNLVYAPNSSPTFLAIEGRTALFAPSLPGSKIFMQAGTTLQLSATSPALTLAEGGGIQLPDGTKLSMSGPATIIMDQKKIVLGGGGKHVSAGGALLQQFPANYVFGTGSNNTLKVYPSSSMEVPAGFLVPTQPTPYVQKPK